MVLTGTRDTAPLLANAATIPHFDAEAWKIEGVELLQILFEVDDVDRESLVPQALHPTIPPAAIFTVARYPDSPVGPFLLAQVKVSCRAAALPRSFSLRAYASTRAAADALGTNFGYSCMVGDVRLSRFHDRVVGEVQADGHELLHASLIDPEPISGGDVQYVATMNLAKKPDGTRGPRPVLVQVDADCTFHKAERGRPQIDAFDQGAWQATGVTPVYPMNATFTTIDGGFPAIRFIADPDKPAVTGTTKLR
jgi:hypothetical protein